MQATAIKNLLKEGVISNGNKIYHLKIMLYNEIFFLFR